MNVRLIALVTTSTLVALLLVLYASLSKAGEVSIKQSKTDTRTSITHFTQGSHHLLYSNVDLNANSVSSKAIANLNVGRVYGGFAATNSNAYNNVFSGVGYNLCDNGLCVYQLGASSTKGSDLSHLFYLLFPVKFGITLSGYGYLEVLEDEIKRSGRFTVSKSIDRLVVGAEANYSKEWTGWLKVGIRF